MHAIEAAGKRNNMQAFQDGKEKSVMSNLRNGTERTSQKFTVRIRKRMETLILV